MATTNMVYSHECIFHRHNWGEINNFKVSLVFYKQLALSTTGTIASISWCSTSKIKAPQKVRHVTIR